MSSPVASSPKFFIEPPVDEFWNTGLPKGVIEAKEQPADEYGNVFLKILAPDSIASIWSIVSKKFY